MLDLKLYHNPPFSNYSIAMTHRPVNNSMVLSHFPSFNFIDNKSYLFLIQDLSITLGSEPPKLFALLPFIMGLAYEDILINSNIYIPSEVTLVQPLNHYINLDSLPLYREYSNFIKDFIKDLEDTGYSPCQTKVIYQVVNESLTSLSYLYKNQTLDTEGSIERVCSKISEVIDLKQIKL
jgi:hypothetical protein